MLQDLISRLHIEFFMALLFCRLSDRLAHPDWPQLYLRDVSDILWSFAVTDHDNISVTILLSKFAKQTLATPKPEDTVCL